MRTGAQFHLALLHAVLMVQYEVVVGAGIDEQAQLAGVDWQGALNDFLSAISAAAGQ